MSRRPHPRSSNWLRVVLATVLVAVVFAHAAPSGAETPQPPVYGLGSLTIEPAIADSVCPKTSLGYADNWTCTHFTVPANTCPMATENAAGYFAQSPDPAGGTKGVVVMFNAGAGGRYWSDGITSAGITAVERMYEEAGLKVLQVRWAVRGWARSALGVKAGPARLACRIATITKYLHDQYWLPLESELLTPAGRCGFCAVGASGSSGGITYMLSHYGMDQYLDAIVPHGGPTHVALDRGCGPRRQDIGYRYPSPDEFDQAYGWRSTDPNSPWYTPKGPCATQDATWLTTWVNDGVTAPGADNYYPGSRVHIVVGETDGRQRQRATREYANWLNDGYADRTDPVPADPLPQLNVRIVAGQGHELNAAGYDAVHAALTWTGGAQGCNNGFDDDWDGVVDLADGGCTGASDLLERQAGAVPARPCDDGLDNDGDGAADYAISLPSDQGCSGVADDSERTPQYPCDDGTDNDGDGLIDFPADPGCPNATAAEGSGGGGPQTISFVATSVSVTERDPGQTQPKCVVKIKLSGVPSADTFVNYATANGTAVAGSDYTAKSGKIKWALGTDKLTRNVSILLTNDSLNENDETFKVNLSAATPAGTTISTPTATCKIVDDAGG
jgi:hypothetical protein